MPVPVFDHISTGCQMAERLQPQLSVIRCPLRKSLCFRLKHKIIVLFQRTSQVSAKSNLCAGQVVLRRMINVASGHGQCPCCMYMIYHRLYTVRISLPLKVKIVCDKLILAGIFLYDARLPHKKFIYQCASEFLELCTKAAVDRAAYIRKIFPCIDPVAPVIKTKCPVHRIQVVMEFFTQIFDKPLLYVASCRVIILRFIVELEANDTFSVCRYLHQLPDDPLCIEEIRRMRNIHDLPCTVNTGSLLRRRQDIRVCLYHPGRDRIGRCADNN